MESPKLDRSPALESALERRDELHESLVALEKALSAPARKTGWRERVHGQLEDVRRVFDIHIGITEGEGGLYDEIMPSAPRLAHMIDGMRAEHGEISERIDIALQSTAAPAGAEEPDALRDELLALLGHLSRHRQKGADLLYEAYDVDLGGQA